MHLMTPPYLLPLSLNVCCKLVTRLFAFWFFSLKSTEPRPTESSWTGYMIGQINTNLTTKTTHCISTLSLWFTSKSAMYTSTFPLLLFVYLVKYQTRERVFRTISKDRKDWIEKMRRIRFFLTNFTILKSDENIFRVFAIAS